MIKKFSPAKVIVEEKEWMRKNIGNENKLSRKFKSCTKLDGIYCVSRD